MTKDKERPRKPLDQQGGLKNKPGEQQKGEDRNDPAKARQPHFDESDRRQQGSDPDGGRQVW